MGAYGHIVQEIKVARSNLFAVNICPWRQESNLDAHSLVKTCILDSVGRQCLAPNPHEGMCNFYVNDL